MIASCPRCSAKYCLEDSTIGPKGYEMSCRKCGYVFPVLPPANESASLALVKTIKATVLVAHDSHAFCKEARRVLEENRHDLKVLIAHDSEGLFSILESKPVNVVLVDMTLPGLFGFEVAAKIKNDKALSHLKVILASSVYEPVGYRRVPPSLCCADDFIEACQLQDLLVDKMVRLISGQTPAAVPPKPAPPPLNEAPGAATPEAQPAASPSDSPDHRKAQRLARTIVSDIAIYHQEAIEKGLKGADLMKQIEKDLKEGRDFYAKRVAKEIRSSTRYLEDELQVLLKAPSEAAPKPEPKPLAVVPKPATKPTAPISKAAPRTEVQPAAPPSDSPDHRKALRLARTIVSDIAIYNQEAIEKGLKGGNLMKLLKFLEKDLKEGRDLYDKRVAEEIRSSTNFLGDELQAMIDRKRKELGL